MQLFTGGNLQGSATSLGFIGGLCSSNQDSLVEQSAPTLAAQAAAHTFMLGTLSPEDTAQIFVGSDLGDTVFLLASKSSTSRSCPASCRSTWATTSPS